MGYCSDVRIVTTKEGFDIIKHRAEENDKNDMVVLNRPTFLCEVGDFIYAGYDNIKYHALSYCCIEYKILDELDTLGIPYTVLRIGEDINDIEIQESELDMGLYHSITRCFDDQDMLVQLENLRRQKRIWQET